MSSDPTEAETRYAKSGDVHIAYQTFGEGPIDLVVVPGFAWHLEYQWENPRIAQVWRRLATFTRVIVLDKRGTGLSDRVPNDELPTLEQRMDDVRAVMDAAGSEQAAILGFWEGGPMCALFAATYPERTRALLLFGAPMAFRQSSDYPWALSDEVNEGFVSDVSSRWGQGSVFADLAPSLADDPSTKKWSARMERTSASPGAAIALWRMNMEIDVLHVLPVIRVPTLVMHRSEDSMVPVEAARYVAKRIHGARLAELPGSDHFFWAGDSDAMVAEIQEFLTGSRSEAEIDRVLATVMFVDIAGSTERAATLGDRRWRELLEDFFAAAGRQLDRFRGQRVNTTGDGFLARFDGPARAIRCADAIGSSSRDLGLEVRAGLHTGECEIVGEDLGGIAVHIGSRVADLASPGEVLVSSTVKDLVAGSGIGFGDRGDHTLKGVPGSWRLYSVESAAA